MLKVKVPTEKQLMRIDRAAAELQEELMESIRINERRPWFFLIRRKLIQLLCDTKSK